MIALPIAAVVIFGTGLFTGFHQSKTNPDANTFLETHSHVVKDGSSID